MTKEIKNGFPILQENLMWRCPSCDRVLVNTDYCFKCDEIDEDEDE